MKFKLLQISLELCGSKYLPGNGEKLLVIFLSVVIWGLFEEIFERRKLMFNKTWRIENLMCDSALI